MYLAPCLTIGGDIGSQSICAGYRYGRNCHIGSRSDHRSDYRYISTFYRLDPHFILKLIIKFVWFFVIAYSYTCVTVLLG